MNHLVPCPDCSRHVRTHESACPFCGSALALQDTPPPLLPRVRLGRAATFAFGATLAGAAALAGCGGAEEGKGGGGTSAGGSASSAGKGGANAAGTGGSSGGSDTPIGPVYGAPAGGMPSDTPIGGSAAALYGAVPVGGSGNFPVYGAAPKE